MTLEPPTDPATGTHPLVDTAGLTHRLRGQLTAARLGAGMSQNDLARGMGTSQSAVSALEAGTGDPRVSTLVRWAAALGLTLDLDTRPALGDVCGPELFVLPTGARVRLDPDLPLRQNRAPVTVVLGRVGSGYTAVLGGIRQWALEQGRPLMETLPGTRCRQQWELEQGTIVLLDNPDLSTAAQRAALVDMLRVSRCGGVVLYVFADYSPDLDDILRFATRVICLAGSTEAKTRTMFAAAGLEPRPERLGAVCGSDRVGNALLREWDGTVHAVRLIPLPDAATLPAVA